jgi:hypothetical protein
MAEHANARAADPGAAASALGQEIVAKHSASRQQVYDIDGHRLPPRRPGLIAGTPRRAVPGWHRLSADRWAEVAR